MNRMLRLVKHRWFDETDTHRALDAKALRRLEARVKSAELAHRGEIRICVEAGLPLSYLWRDATARERAVAMFGKLRVWDTELNSGVLIYLLLAEHAIEIVADRGLNRHVSQAYWDKLTKDMSAAFKSEGFEQGLMSAIDAVDKLLRQHFPVAESHDNPDELPNRPYLG